MEEINVGLGDRSYPILIARGSVLNSDVGYAESLFSTAEDSVVVTDETVYELYGDNVFKLFDLLGIRATPVVVAPGEPSKNLSVFGSLMDLFAAAGLSRKGLVFALGGGVVGDLAGFAASSWMRGISYVQIPTTLLAMVDSSVGGKTAVDIPAGKNLVGAFHQPSFVLIDPSLLSTLPEREYKSGMAEVIKYGAIYSADLFDELESMSQRRGGVNDPSLDGIIASCIRIKADVVGEDELDTGIRQILNFGHTFGHAIEVMSGFSKYTHGEAVGAGMRIASAYGEAMGITKAGTSQRLCALLDGFGLDLVIDPAVYTDLVPYIKGDKKAFGDSINLILLKKIGESVVFPVSIDELEEGLRKLQA